MPHKALHSCAHGRCSVLVESGEKYCSFHKPSHKDDYIRRHPEYQKQYNNQRWVMYRKQYLAEHPYCINYDTCHNLATVVDHIIDHEGDYQRFWEHTNHQPMCKQCHDKKTASTKGWGK